MIGRFPEQINGIKVEFAGINEFLNSVWEEEDRKENPRISYFG